MKRFFLFLFFLACSWVFNLYAQVSPIVSGKLIDAKQNAPIPFATVVVLSMDSTLVKGGITDTLGCFNLNCDVNMPFMLRISCVGYEDYYQKHNSGDVGSITLDSKVIDIAEIKISPDEIQSFTTHRAYRPNINKIKSFDNFLQSLSIFPTLKITHDNKLSTIDGKQVKILINGANATEADLMTLAPDNIGKIEVYDNPPTRFALQGITMLVNIRTKNDVRGGSVSIQTNNALTTANGNNLVSITYNRDRFRFTAGLDNLYRDVFQLQNETISYKFDSIDYSRDKLGIESPFKWNLNKLKFGASYTKPDDLQINATFHTDFNRRNENLSQRIIGNIDDCIADKTSQAKYNMYSADLYLSKRLNASNELLFNVIGSAYDSKLITGYQEKQLETVLFNSHDDITAQKRSAIFDAQYQHTSARKIVYTVGVYDFIENSHQTIFSTPYKSMRNNAWAYVDATANVKDWYFFVRMGVNHTYFKSEEHTFDKTFISPQVRITYYPSQWSALFVSYTKSNVAPSISMLSETPIWYDYRYAFHGNANLKPYTKHDFLFGGYWASAYVVCAWNLSYEHSPNAFLPYFAEKDNFIAETYGNMRLLQTVSGVVQLDVQPLGDERIKLMASGVYTIKNITGIDYDWKHHSWRIIPEIEFNYKKWRALLFYQPGQELADGQLLRRSPRVTMVEAGYRFPFGLNLSIGGKYLFDKDWRDGSLTHKSALVQQDIWNIVPGYANMVYLKLAYTFGFGAQGKAGRQRLNNSDVDSGVLLKK